MKVKSTKHTGVPQRLRLLMAVGIFTGFTGLSAWAADPAAPGAVDPHANEMLHRTSEYLAHSPFFSVNAEVWQDVVLSSGQRVQAARTIDLEVRRPDRLHAEVRSTHRNRGIWYDGKTISILNRKEDLYGDVPAPKTLDQMLDVALVKFGIAIPLEDLIQSNPYAAAMKNVSGGIDLGPTTVLGVKCEHLAFTQDNIDWQVWIEEGPRPVPRKIVITYKDEEGSPQYTALLSKWDFETKLPDFVFTFEPPPDAAKINVMEVAPNHHNQQPPQLQQQLPKE